MKSKRTLHPQLLQQAGRVYAFGGSKGEGDMMDEPTGIWTSLPSYEAILPKNDLQAFSLVLINS